MQISLRYFHNPKTGGFVTSVGLLAFALKHKCKVKNVIHWHSKEIWAVRDNQIQAFLDCARLLRLRLLIALWNNCAVITWALSIAALLWWLPTGLPIRWGWAAFSVLMSLPFIIAVLGFRNGIMILILGKRLSSRLGSMMDAKPNMAPFMACPTMLLSGRKEKAVKKWPALISLIFLLAFMSVRVTIPLRGWVPIIHDLNGNTVSAKEIRRLKPGEFWEYAPRFIRGEAWGMLYFEENMEKALVLSADYTLENTRHRSPTAVRKQMQTWISNIAYYFAMTIRGGASVDLDRGELADETRERIKSEPVQAAMRKSIKEEADANLKEQFTSLEFEVRWVSIDEYVNKVR